jgi:hypothetical protein
MMMHGDVHAGKRFGGGCAAPTPSAGLVALGGFLRGAGGGAVLVAGADVALLSAKLARTLPAAAVVTVHGGAPCAAAAHANLLRTLGVTNNFLAAGGGEVGGGGGAPCGGAPAGADAAAPPLPLAALVALASIPDPLTAALVGRSAWAAALASGAVEEMAGRAEGEEVMDVEELAAVRAEAIGASGVCVCGPPPPPLPSHTPCANFSSLPHTRLHFYRAGPMWRSFSAWLPRCTWRCRPGSGCSPRCGR